MSRKGKTAAVLIALVMALYLFTGCTQMEQGLAILHDTETLYIESEGAETRVCDLVGNTTYTIKSHRTRRKLDARQSVQANTETDTDTITIKTVYDILIVVDKTTGETVYIR